MKLMKANDLPKNWQLKTLAQVCISTGSNITLKNIQDKKGDYPIYGASGVVSYVDFYTKENQSLGIVKDGAGIGRVFLLPPKASVIGTLHYVESNDDLNLKFLFYFLQSINLARYITGSAIPHIYFRDWKKEQIPIPPLEIQRRIVKSLDEAFSRIENGTKHLQSAKDNLTKYKQSLLKSAFNGTLTQDCPLSQCESTKSTHSLAPSAREGEKESCHALKSPLPQHEGHLGVGNTRNDENSPSLAEGVRGWVNPLNDNALDCHADKSARNDDKDSLNGESANIPQGWTIKTLGEVCEFAYGKGLKSAKRKTNGKYPVYAANGIKDYSDEYMIKEPSIIVGRKGSVGSLVLTNTPCWVLDVSYYVVFDKQKYDLMFLYHLLKTLNLNQYARGVKPGLSRSQAYELKVKIPPLEIQRQIVAILERHFTSADKVGAYINSCLTKAKQLKSSLLKSAFEGKL